ncbi:alpha/beta fold hydrolase [Nonomuraea dietziae]|uniref:alpha/beta fold hydrolase n=1 Tax=Nonomuraea dietziae TaxID=65515 RepID=UPI003384DB20
MCARPRVSAKGSPGWSGPRWCATRAPPRCWRARGSRWFAGEPSPALLDDLATTDPLSYAACCEALARYDLRADLGEILQPVLVVAGRDDPATPPSHGRELADGLPDATLMEIPSAAHLANVDRPAAVTAALEAHLRAPVTGMSVRRDVLGDAHVDRAIAATTPFTPRLPGPHHPLRVGRDLDQARARPPHPQLHHPHRPGRARSPRRAGHARAGRAAQRAHPDEIGEVLLQTAVYCGVPAANSAFAVAQRVLREEGR